MADDLLVAPHGGVLVDRLVTGEQAEALRARSVPLPRITLDERERSDLELLAVGAFSPLTGFLDAADYAGVVDGLRLANGVVWPLPVTLAVDDDTRRRLEPGVTAALHDATGRPWGVLDVSEVFPNDPGAEARLVYGTDDPAHPGVAALVARPRWRVGGPVRVLPLPEDLPFAAYRLTPRALREAIRQRGWRSVAGFQTRNPIHRAHEHLTKIALELADGLVLHPLVGETKGDDVPASVRFRAYEALLARYYPRQRTLLAAFPAAMRYAGPREALFHALVRKNYGISHFIVGRDHAGVGKYYGPLDAQAIFDRFTFAEIGVSPLRLDATFFCRACGATASARTCPHDAGDRLQLSGTEVRAALRRGDSLPPEFTRPEVAEVLRVHYVIDPPPYPSPHTGEGTAVVGSAPRFVADPPPHPSPRVPDAPGLFPAFLKLDGRPVVVVGGGPVAASKIVALRQTGAVITVVAPKVQAGIEAWGVTVKRRGFVAADLDGAWLVVAAATREINRDVAAAAEERRVFVNAVDDPASASAYAGAVLRRGPVTVAVSTDGQAPALAGLLREALESVVPDDVAGWAETARAERSRWIADGVPLPLRRPLLLDVLNRLYAERAEQGAA
jgi:ATP sulfurylase